MTLVRKITVFIFIAINVIKSVINVQALVKVNMILFVCNSNNNKVMYSLTNTSRLKVCI